MILLLDLKQMFLKSFYDNTIEIFIFWSEAPGLEFFSALCAQLPLTFTQWKKMMDFFVLFALVFAMKLKDANYKSHRNNLVFCDHWKILPDLNISHRTLSDFVSFLLFRSTLVIKLRNCDFESHWNSLVFFDKKYMTSYLTMSHGKISDFVSFALFWITLTIKLRKFDLENH